VRYAIYWYANCKRWQEGYAHSGHLMISYWPSGLKPGLFEVHFNTTLQYAYATIDSLIARLHLDFQIVDEPKLREMLATIQREGDK